MEKFPVGLRLRVFGSKGGIEWDLEKPEILKFNRSGEPDSLLSRGQGGGIDLGIERFVRLGVSPRGGRGWIAGSSYSSAEKASGKDGRFF